MGDVVGNKNSSYNNKTHKIPKETLVEPPTKLEVGTQVYTSVLGQR